MVILWSKQEHQNKYISNTNAIVARFVKKETGLTKIV